MSAAVPPAGWKRHLRHPRVRRPHVRLNVSVCGSDRAPQLSRQRLNRGPGRCTRRRPLAILASVLIAPRTEERRRSIATGITNDVTESHVAGDFGRLGGVLHVIRPVVIAHADRERVVVGGDGSRGIAGAFAYAIAVRVASATNTRSEVCTSLSAGAAGFGFGQRGRLGRRGGRHCRLDHRGAECRCHQPTGGACRHPMPAHAGQREVEPHLEGDVSGRRGCLTECCRCRGRRCASCAGRCAARGGGAGVRCMRGRRGGCRDRGLLWGAARHRTAHPGVYRHRLPGAGLGAATARRRVRPSAAAAAGCGVVRACRKRGGLAAAF